MKIDKDTLDALSTKQREALDLLILHKTSKEISRILGISPHTVDQRLGGSKIKLGVRSRGELAQAYRHLITICERVTYDESGIAKSAVPLEQDDRLSAERFLIQRDLEVGETSCPAAMAQSVQILPKLFEGRWRILVRLGVIALIAFLLAASVLSGIAIFQLLSGLLAHPP